MAQAEKDLHDLKYEMLEFKKKLHSVSSENYLLKVRIRKLENELEKKNKHIESLIDPKKSTCVRKILTERGASLIVDLKKRNSELIHAIDAKDAYIKRMQSELQTSKTYLPNNLLRNKHSGSKHSSLNSNESNSDSRINSFRSRSTTPTPRLHKTSSAVHVVQHLEQNLQKIIRANNNKISVSACNSSRKNTTYNLNSAKSTSSNKINNNNYYRTNEQSDINKLLKEMENMKDIISKLSMEQQNTKKYIKEKNRSIEFLSKQIKHLQKNKTKKSGDTIILQMNDKNKKLEEKVNLSYSQDSFENDSSGNLNDSKQSQFKSLFDKNSDDDDDDDVETEASNNN